MSPKILIQFYPFESTGYIGRTIILRNFHFLSVSSQKCKTAIINRLSLGRHIYFDWIRWVSSKVRLWCQRTLILSSGFRDIVKMEFFINCYISETNGPIALQFGTKIHQNNTSFSLKLHIISSRFTRLLQRYDNISSVHATIFWKHHIFKFNITFLSFRGKITKSSFIISKVSIHEQFIFTLWFLGVLMRLLRPLITTLSLVNNTSHGDGGPRDISQSPSSVVEASRVASRTMIPPSPT